MLANKVDLGFFFVANIFHFTPPPPFQVVNVSGVEVFDTYLYFAHLHSISTSDGGETVIGKTEWLNRDNGLVEGMGLGSCSDVLFPKLFIKGMIQFNNSIYHIMHLVLFQVPLHRNSISNFRQTLLEAFCHKYCVFCILLHGRYTHRCRCGAIYKEVSIGCFIILFYPSKDVYSDFWFFIDCAVWIPFVFKCVPLFSS